MYDVKPMTSSRQVDCGPTCLQMLLYYYDIEVALEELIEECHTRIVGCNAKDLVKAGKKYGLDMHAYKMDPNELYIQDRPSIIWWRNNHFCICCGINRDGEVIICNPDRGRYRMPKETFESYYSGVAIFNGEPEDCTVPYTYKERVEQLERRLASLIQMQGLTVEQIDDYQFEVVKPSFDPENPLVYKEGMELVNNAFYLKEDGKVYVWMNEWVEW